MAKTKEERLAEVRKRYQEQSGRRSQDPNEWKPPKVQEGKEYKVKFIILPPLEVGDKCYGGTNTTNMRGLPTYRGGTHWINNRPYECPRLHDNEECKYCQYGFDLLSETEDKDDRRQILRAYVANEFYAVNIYFPPYKSCPPDLRGKVMWWKVTQKTVWTKFRECLERNEEDARGDTPEEELPWGFFYEPDEAYQFLLHVTSKGDFNNYELSKFIASTKGPIIAGDDGEVDWEKLQPILDQRHDLGAKFDARDGAKLAGMVDALDSPEPESEADSGFDEDELLDEDTSSTAATASSDDELIDDTEEATPEEPKAESKSTSKKKSAPPADEVDDDEVDALLQELQEG